MNGNITTRSALSSAEIRQCDLVSAARFAGTNFRITQPQLADHELALRGDYSVVRLRQGLMVHSCDTFDVHDLTTEIVQKPGVTFSLFLKGHVSVAMGERKFNFGQFGNENSSHLEGTVIAKARAENFVRRSRKGMHIRKVNVTISPEWLDREGLEDVPGHKAVCHFMTDHLSLLRWRPSMRLISLAEQILRLPKYSPLLRNLYLESRAIEIVAEAIHAIGGTTPDLSVAHIRPRDHQRIAEFRELLDSKLDANFTLPQIARDAGMSPNTLQRLFHAVYGRTIFDYVRMRKLERARDTLERDGVTVAEAAYIAGYTSAANFATAFKRAFGSSPKTFRTSV